MGDWRLELLRRSYEASGRQDGDAIVEVWHPGCVWDMGPWGPVSEVRWEGHEGLRGFMAFSREEFRSARPQIVEARAVGQVVLLRGRTVIEVKSVDRPMEMRFGQVITFRDGLIHRVVQTDDPPVGWDEAEPVE